MPGDPSPQRAGLLSGARTPSDDSRPRGFGLHGGEVPAPPPALNGLAMTLNVLEVHLVADSNAKPIGFSSVDFKV